VVVVNISFPCVVTTQLSAGCLIVEVSRSHTRTSGRTPLHEWSARRSSRRQRNIQERRTSMSLAGFEPAIPVIKRPQTARPPRWPVCRITPVYSADRLVPAELRSFRLECYILLRCT